MNKKYETNEGKVFQRVEKKYLVSEAEKKEFLRLCGKNLKKNKYFASTVCSIYFDTENDDLIIKQIDKPLDRFEFKEKVRLRSYNIPKKTDSVFFEAKTKRRKSSGIKIGNKRRLEILLKDYYDWENGKASLVEIAERKIEKTNDVQIAKELEYLVRYLKLKPKILIACERESFEGSEDKALRVTFDRNLRYRTENLKLDKGADGKKYFSDQKNIILEIKTEGGMPLWLVRTLSELKIYPQPFSKYGKIYQQMKGKTNVQYHI